MMKTAVYHLHPAPGWPVLHLQLPQQDPLAPPVADPGQTGERQAGQEGNEESGQDVHCHPHSLRSVLATLPRLLPRPLLLSGKYILSALITLACPKSLVRHDSHEVTISIWDINSNCHWFRIWWSSSTLNTSFYFFSGSPWLTQGRGQNKSICICTYLDGGQGGLRTKIVEILI